MGRVTLSVAEVAELMGVSTSFVYNLVSQKLIPHKRIGGRRILFHRPTIEAWLSEVE
jgi:excisionase family DNA binding protein